MMETDLSHLLQSMSLRGSWNVLADVVSLAQLCARRSRRLICATQDEGKHQAVVQVPAAGSSLDECLATNGAVEIDMIDIDEARCPSPLFFSTSLLTLDDLILDIKPKGKAKSALIKAHLKRASSMRLRTPPVYPRAVVLGIVPYNRRRLPGNHLHSPRHVPGVPSGSPRVHLRLQRHRVGSRAEGLEVRSRQ